MNKLNVNDFNYYYKNNQINFYNCINCYIIIVLL